MLRKYALSLLLLSALAAPCVAAGEPTPVLGADGKPLEVTARVPNNTGIGLSFAMPGAAQLYLGDPSKGYTYMGAAVGGGLGLAAAEHLYLTSMGTFINPESVAFEVVQGLVLSWLVVGTLSAFDAAGAIAARQPTLTPPPEAGAAR